MKLLGFCYKDLNKRADIRNEKKGGKLVIYKKQNKKTVKKFLENRTVSFTLPSVLWSRSIYNFYKDETIPPNGTYASIFAIIKKDDEVLLVYNKGREKWELPGGHLSPEELSSNDPIAGVKREVLEETGYEIENVSQLGFGHINVTKPIINRETGEPYPFPNSFLLFFKADLKKDVPQRKLEHEIEICRFYSISSAKRILGEYTDGQILNYL